MTGYQSKKDMANAKLNDDDDTQVYKKPWVDLTEDEIEAIGDKVANEKLVGTVPNFRVRFARAIEQLSKEKNL